MSIDNIVSIFAGNGVARAGRFEVLGAGFPPSRMANAYIRNVSFPGISFGTSSAMDKNAPTKYPYSVLYNEMTITFSDDENGSMYAFYAAWMASILTSEGFGYYKDYVRPLEVYQLNTQGTQSIGVKVREAYPSNLSEVAFSQDSHEATTFTVIMTYKDYEVV